MDSQKFKLGVVGGPGSNITGKDNEHAKIIREMENERKALERAERSMIMTPNRKQRRAAKKRSKRK